MPQKKSVKKPAGTKRTKSSPKAIKKTPKKIPIEDLGIFKPKQMDIYEYFNGKDMVKEDPLVLYKKVMDRAQELDSNLKGASYPGFNKATECHNNLIKDLREIFDVPPAKEGGLTEPLMEDLLDHFLKFCDTVKKNWSMIPMPRMATSPATPALSNSTTEETQPTLSTLDSGSIEKESCTSKPEPSPSVPVLPTSPLNQAWSIGVTPPTGKRALPPDKDNIEQPCTDDGPSKEGSN